MLQIVISQQTEQPKRNGNISEIYNLPKLNKEEIDNLNKEITLVN